MIVNSGGIIWPFLNPGAIIFYFLGLRATYKYNRTGIYVVCSLLCLFCNSMDSKKVCTRSGLASDSSDNPEERDIDLLHILLYRLSITDRFT